MTSGGKAFKSLILGAPGSGKGTISSRIVKFFGLPHISSGDKLRWHIKNGTPLGLQAKEYIDKGVLVPNDVMVKFILGELKSHQSWLLDGFPRTLAQAQELWSVETLDLAINLNVPFGIIIDRVKTRWVHLDSGRVYNIGFNDPKVPGKDDVTGEDLMQRKDDDPEVVKKRLEEYEKMTRPMFAFYQERGIFAEFSGNTSDEIWPQVRDHLTGFIPLIGSNVDCDK